MVSSCCVLGCTNSAATNRKSTSSRTSISLYRFPRVRIRYSAEFQKLLRKQRLAWLAAVRRDELSENKLDWLRICSEHFVSGVPADFRDTENPDWVPHLHMGYEASDDECEGNREESLKQFSPKDESPMQFSPEEALEHFSPEEVLLIQFSTDEETEDESNVNGEINVGVQTDMSSTYIAALEAELLKRNEELYELRAHLADLLWTEESFKNNDKKSSYYTGLSSFKLFKLVLDQLQPALLRIKSSKLDNFQKLLLTLMKLRLNMSFTDLAYRFRISIATVSACFRKVVVLVVHTFQGFLHWPDRDPLLAAMPLCFKEAFGNSIAVIVNCFEIPTQRPASAKARAQSFSSHKHNYTTKYLIGITPHGFVSFISDGWDGRASDKFISEHSGLLDNLLPGDVVMSDRGFTIKESGSMDYAELLTPKFLHNEMQLSPEDVEETRKIAPVRVHVERILRVMKNKFKILRGPVPTEFLKFKHDDKSVLDYVVRAACILTNLCDSVVPLGEPHKTNKNVNVLRDKNFFTDNFNCIK